MSTRNVYISRRNFMKAGAFAAAIATLSVPALAASAEEENCLGAKITTRRSTQYGPVVGLDQGESLVWYGIPYGADIYLCQIDYGDPAALSQIPMLGAFHGIFVPMLSTVNNYAAMVDFSGEGYQEMATLFNRYLKNFLTTGDPTGNLFTGIRGLFSGDSTLPKWQNWTPDNKVSMVMDASATDAQIGCKDVSTTYEEIMDRMDADTTVSAELKQKMIRNVMNGRWFSAALDARYGNPTLWK